MRSRSCASGFTLLEMIMVLVIVGVLAAVAVPRMIDRNDVAELGYRDQLIAATRYAQKLAVTSHCETRVVIAADSFTLQRHTAVADCGSNTNWTNTALPGDTGAYSSPGVTTSPATITFLASGAADATYTVTVGTLQFTVHQATGYVERL